MTPMTFTVLPTWKTAPQ